MWVGFIHTSCRSVCRGSGTRAAGDRLLLRRGSVAESGPDTSRAGVGFPPLPLVITGFCDHGPLTSVRPSPGNLPQPLDMRVPRGRGSATLLPRGRPSTQPIDLAGLFLKRRPARHALVLRCPLKDKGPDE